RAGGDSRAGRAWRGSAPHEFILVKTKIMSRGDLEIQFEARRRFINRKATRGNAASEANRRICLRGPVPEGRRRDEWRRPARGRIPSSARVCRTPGEIAPLCGEAVLAKPLRRGGYNGAPEWQEGIGPLGQRSTGDKASVYYPDITRLFGIHVGPPRPCWGSRNDVCARAAFHHSSFNPSWISLGAFAELIRPKFADPVPASGKPNCAWLKALNISLRNCSRVFSRKGSAKSFWMPRSQLFTPGPLKIARPALPKYPREVIVQQVFGDRVDPIARNCLVRKRQAGTGRGRIRRRIVDNGRQFIEIAVEH